MYKNQRRKSNQLGRAQPYDITSSSIANRKSGQFISPIVNYDLSLSVLQKKEDTRNLSLSALQTVEDSRRLSDLNQSAVGLANKSAPVVSSSTDSGEEINKMDKQLIDGRMSSSSNHQISEQINESTNQISELTNQIRESANQIDKIQSNRPSDECNVPTNVRKQTEDINEAKSTSQCTDDMFDSEIDRLFGNASFENRTKPSEEALDGEVQSDDEVYGREGEELFDSDAINNEEYDSQLSQNAASVLDNLYQIDQLENDEIEDDDLDLELDSTLIFRSNDPIQSQFITKPIEHPPIDDGFKTASGVPIQIKMSLEEQRIRARRLGIWIDE